MTNTNERKAQHVNGREKAAQRKREKSASKQKRAWRERARVR